MSHLRRDAVSRLLPACLGTTLLLCVSGCGNQAPQENSRPSPDGEIGAGTESRKSPPREKKPARQWLDGYSGQTVDQMLTLEGKCPTDSLVLAFEQAIDKKAARLGLKKLTEVERIILAVESLEREVNNGGYDQFFRNTPKFAPIIVKSLRRIGCPRTAKITQRALATLGLRHLTVKGINKAIGEENKERDRLLNECDELYYTRPENIEERLFAFIKANRHKIKL